MKHPRLTRGTLRVATNMHIAASKDVAAVAMERVWDPGRSDMGFSPVCHQEKPGDVFE